MKTNSAGEAPQGGFRKVDGSAAADGKKNGDAVPERENLGEDSRKFGTLMHKPAKKNPEGVIGETDAHGGMGEKTVMEETGADGLASLFGGMSALIGEHQAAPPMATASPEQVGKLAAAVNTAHCEELVNRILVSTPESGAAPEVRIRLDETWLPKTEVSVVRDANGGVTVDFMSDSVESQRFLLPNLDGLRTRLAENMDAGRVTVRMSEEMPEGMAGGDNREGRHSRERRNLYEEMGE